MGSEKIAGVLGNYIEKVKEVIPYNKEIPVKGLSKERRFVKTHIANLDKISSPFQLIKKWEFCYSKFIDTNKQLTFALNHQSQVFQISCAYIAFRVVKEKSLNCFYLDLFLKKDVVDVLVKYICTGGVREELSWNNFCSIPISIPDLEIQETIVNKYQTVTKYIEIKKKINELLEKKMRAYFHILFDDLKEYEIKSFGELFSIIGGSAPPKSNKWLEELYFCKEGGIPLLQTRDITRGELKFISETSEQLTEKGFKRGKCSMIPPNNLIFIQNATWKQLGRIYLNTCNLTINTNLWAFSNNLAGGGINITYP